MNNINSIIRILEIPSLKSQNNMPIIEFRAQLPYLRNIRINISKQNIVVNCIVRGELAYDIVNYYRVNDYVLIEGYVSILPINLGNKSIITLNIVRLYPFLFTF